MNDWYNTNEHRSYPFVENLSPSKPLPENEILDCRFYLKNAEDTKVYLYSRTVGENEITYVFKTNVGDIELSVPKTHNYKVIKFGENDGINFGYGFVVFGDTTTTEEENNN